MESVKPTLNAGEIMAHDATRNVGQVVETICPPDQKLNGFELVLLLLDGTRQSFRLTELRPASEIETRMFMVAALE